MLPQLDWSQVTAHLGNHHQVLGTRIHERALFLVHSDCWRNVVSDYWRG